MNSIATFRVGDGFPVISERLGVSLLHFDLSTHLASTIAPNWMKPRPGIVLGLRSTYPEFFSDLTRPEAQLVKIPACEESLISENRPQRPNKSESRGMEVKFGLFSPTLVPFLWHPESFVL